jgi:hypothetical protein
VEGLVVGRGPVSRARSWSTTRHGDLTSQVQSRLVWLFYGSVVCFQGTAPRVSFWPREDALGQRRDNRLESWSYRLIRALSGAALFTCAFAPDREPEMIDPDSNEHAFEGPVPCAGENAETFPRRCAATESSLESAPESTLDLINRISRDCHRAENVVKFIEASGKAVALPLIGVSAVLGAGTLIFGQSAGVLFLIGGVLISRAFTTAGRNVTKRRTSTARRGKR